MWVQVPLSLTMKIKNNLKLDYKKRNLYTNLELPINLLKIITNNKILNNNIRNEKENLFKQFAVHNIAT